MKENSEFIIIQDREEGERIDKILASRFKGVQSRTYFQNLISSGLVLLNGEPIKKRIQPKAGDEVEIEFILSPEISLKPENIPLDILFEDQNLIIINKPAGMVVHPAPGNWNGTFVNALLYHCQNLPKGEDLRPGIVHRLDKDTTGLLVAAKNNLTQQKLVEMFSLRKIEKRYLALCLGNPGEREIKTYIGRHPIHRKQMTVTESGGKEAITKCKTLKHNEKYSLVSIDLLTGRTHQIRVHMKYIHTPILGDPLYGNKNINERLKLYRQMLHAQYLKFQHPITGEILEITAPLPEDMGSLMNF